MTPKSFKARFIEPGIISYDDQSMGVVLVSKEALDRMAPTFKGCPVIFIPEDHDESDKNTAFNFDDVSANPPSGIVTGSPYWGEDGWQYAEMLIWDENATQAIERGFSVSCAYLVDDTSEGGEWHQVPYDEEITAGHYMHMAIVANPRYEGSQIMANSKGGHKVALFQKKKNAAPPPAPKPETPEKEKKETDPIMMNADTEVDVNGTPVPLHELIAKYMESQGEGAPAALADADMVALPDGSQVSVADLKAAYGGGADDGEIENACDKPVENAEPPQDMVAVTPVDTAKQVSNSAPSPVKAPVRVVNEAVKNAAKNGDTAFDPRGEFDTESARLARGKARYSRPVNQGGK